MSAATHSPTITVGCKVCGQPMTLDIDPTLPESLYRSCAAMAQAAALCRSCHQKTESERRGTEAATRLMAISERWESITPTRYHDSDVWLETPEAALKVNMAAIARVVAWRPGGRGLMIYGSRSGSGKTTAYWLKVRDEILSGRYVAAMTHSEFSRTATEMATERHSTADRWRRYLKTCDTLFIDDLGKSRFTTGEGAGKVAEETLFEIIDERLNEKRPIIITTNDTPVTMEKRMSADRSGPLIRRLKEACEPIPFD